MPPAKNSYLPILAACMLCSSTVVLHDVPRFSDIDKMVEILEVLGCKTTRNERTLTINCENAVHYKIPEVLAKEIRASVFLLGAILSKLKKAEVSYPGGCDLGPRPIDLHIKGLQALNVNITEQHGKLICDASNFKNDIVHLDFPSVGATENIMMVSVLSTGITQIINAAKEPEIVDLQNFINSMGGKIYGAGTGTITVVGVNKLHGTEYTAIPDRIIAGTYIIAAAAAGGEILIKNVNYQHIYSLIAKFKNSSCKITAENDKIRVQSNKRLNSIAQIETQPYPGFATDLQAQIMVLECISKGTSVITENVFETRFKHAAELAKMGADITLKGRTAIVRGTDKLYGAEVTGSDLRAGAALTIAGLVAGGTTVVHNVSQIDRGYEKLEEALSRLGADIRRMTE